MCKRKCTEKKNRYEKTPKQSNGNVKTMRCENNFGY